MKALGVIPARYASTRLPGKSLIPLAGKPMIERVWERARQAASLSGVVVATDDERIFNVVKAFGGEAVLTRADHRSGTERVAEVAVARQDAEIFVNVQGDEPLIDPVAIDQAVAALHEDANVQVATLAVPIGRSRRHHGPQCGEDGARFRRQRTVLFARADSLGARPRRAGACAASEAPWSVRVPPGGVARFPYVSAGRSGTRGAARAACAGWKTATASAWWKPNTIRSVWTCRKTWHGSSRCSGASDLQR